MSNLQDKAKVDNQANVKSEGQIPAQYLNRTSSTPIGNEVEYVNRIQQFKHQNDQSNLQNMQNHLQNQNASQTANQTEENKVKVKKTLKLESKVYKQSSNEPQQPENGSFQPQQQAQLQLNQQQMNPNPQSFTPKSMIQTPTGASTTNILFSQQTQNQQQYKQQPFYPQGMQYQQMQGQNQPKQNPQNYQVPQYKQQFNQYQQPYNPQAKPYPPQQHGLHQQPIQTQIYPPQQHLQPIQQQVQQQVQTPQSHETPTINTLDQQQQQQQQSQSQQQQKPAENTQQAQPQQEQKQKKRLNANAKVYTTATQPTVDQNNVKQPEKPLQLQKQEFKPEAQQQPATAQQPIQPQTQTQQVQVQQQQVQAQQPQQQQQQQQQVQQPVQQQAQQVQQSQEVAKQAPQKPVRISLQILLQLIKRAQEQITDPSLVKFESLKSLLTRQSIRSDMRISKIVPGPGNKNYNQNQNQYQKEQTQNQDGFMRQTQDESNPNANASNIAIARAPVDPQKQEMLDKQKQWLEKIKKSKEDDESEEAVIKKMKLNLNILTAENFEKLKTDIIDQVMKNKKNCKTFIQLIIEKAWTEKKYVPIYAKLCFIIQEKKIYFKKEGEEVNENDKKNSFKRYLLKKIQRAFEYQEVNVKNKKNFEELTEDEAKVYLEAKRKRIFGNVEFIGELLLSKVLSRQVIYICSLKMMQDFSERYSSFQIHQSSESKNFEDNLEGIIVLMHKVGKQIESDSSKDKDHNPQRDFDYFKRYLQAVNEGRQPEEAQKQEIFSLENLSFEGLFLILDFIKKSCKISVRITCLIENLLERRLKKWIEQQQQKDLGPLTLKQIHEIHYKEQLASQQFQSHEQQNPQYHYKQQKQDYYQKYDQKYQGQKQYVQVAQVAEDKQSQENQTLVKKEYQGKSDKKVSLQYGVNRTKYEGSQKPQGQSKQNLLSGGQVKEFLKKFFKNLQDKKENLFDDTKSTEEQAQSQIEAPYDSNKFYLDIKEKIVKKTSNQTFLNEFFQLFWDGSITIVNQRLFVIYNLFKENLLQKQDFVKEFSNFLIKSCPSLSDDIPHLKQYNLDIFFDFVKDNHLRFDDIQFDKNLLNEQNQNDDGQTVFFLEEFIEHIYNQLKKQNLHESYREQLLKLTKQFKSEEAEEWFNSSCK